MISRIIRIKQKMIVLSTVAVLLLQSLTILSSFSMARLFFFLILNLIILIMIYGFRGFESVNLCSYINAFYSFLSGFILASIPSAVLIVLFRPGISLLTYVVSILFFLFVMPISLVKIFRTFIPRLPARRCIIIGKEKEFGQMLLEISDHLLGHLKIIEYMNPSPKVLEERILDEIKPDSIIIADPALVKGVESVLDLARERDISIEYLPTLAESTLRRIPITLLKQFPAYYNVAFSRPRQTLSKRLMDLFIAVLGLLITLPLTLFFLFAIPLSSGFPVIFTQKRIGKGMKPFLFFKFRSLRNLKPEDQDPEETPNATIPKRMTAFGNFMRKLRLDELPQFINVLLNNMSVIGPRPEMEEYHTLCMHNIPWYEKRYLLKPGITGWAQINYKHTSTVEDYIRKTEYDLYYVKNCNLKLDLEITIKTLQTMLGKRGSV